MRGKSFGYPKPQEFGFGGLVPLVAATARTGMTAGPKIINQAFQKVKSKINPNATTVTPAPPNITQNPFAFKNLLTKRNFGLATVGGTIATIGTILALGGEEEVKDEVSNTGEETAFGEKLFGREGLNEAARELRLTTDEFMRVAKNTAIADPGSFAQRFGKAILLGLSNKMAAQGATGAEKSRSEFDFNATKDTILDYLLDPMNPKTNPKTKQKWEPEEAVKEADRIANQYAGRGPKVSSSNPTPTPNPNPNPNPTPKYKKGDEAIDNDGTELVFDGTKWVAA